MTTTDAALHRAAFHLREAINRGTPPDQPSVTVGTSSSPPTLHLYVHSSFRDYLRSANRLPATADALHPDGYLSPDAYPDPETGITFPIRWRFSAPRPVPLIDVAVS